MKESNRMKIDGGITLLVNKERVTIELHDNNTSTTFVKIEMEPKDFCAALSRLTHTPCKMEVNGLEKIGKKMELKTFEFEIPDLLYTERSTYATAHAKKYCPKGWEPDTYFGSQDSFIYRNSKQYAKTTIRKWI